MPITSINPATGETLRTFDELGDHDVDRKLDLAATTFRDWRRSPLAERAAVLRKAAEILDGEKDELGRLMTLEMGKLHRAAREESAKCALACRYYADYIDAFLAPEIIYEQNREIGRVVFRPIGPVLAVMPWNFPFWQVIRFAAPAIAAGNVGLLKHASNVPQCALAIEDVFRRSGAPTGVFQTLLIGSGRVESLIADRRVAAVTLTGSEGAGAQVASHAGRHLKKCVLELGGSDPFIVMPSADVARAAEVAVTARTINNGQSCIAAKRFIIADAVYDEFERRFLDRVRALRVGDPMEPGTDLGPLATAQIADDLAKQVARSVEMGARVLFQGKRRPGRGNYVAPAVLGDPPPGSPAYSEELFGPVAALFRARDLDDAIRIANDTTFGLGASVWTTDAAETERFIDEIETGQVFVNAMVASDPRFPFGGVKRSGYGRELALYGQREFQNITTVRGMTEVAALSGAKRALTGTLTE
jgi:succinate-semialdehyde dehydrogenase/glutarate-semialdehyde dehydrogenase